MREKVLVLSGEDGAGNHQRDVLIPADPPMFGGHLYQRLAIDVVDVADGREVEADERFQVRQIGSVEIDVIKTDPDDSDCYECCKKEKPSGRPPPAQRRVAATADSASYQRPSAGRHAPEPG